LHAPTARLKEQRDDRVHARMAMIRDLFGLEVENGSVASADFAGSAADELAEVRELRPGQR
jgi:hypothetical protein